jgi:hypothetical protein
VLDYAFVKLGLDDETVAHPALMTERLATPLHSRACEYMAVPLAPYFLIIRFSDLRADVRAVFRPISCLLC